MKKITAFLLAALMLTVLGAPALAESYTGGTDWNVTFTADKEMVSNFRSSELDEAVAGLQPGDDIEFTVRLKNEYPERVSWYMLNDVLYSLEDRSTNPATAGGGYSYELLYADPEGETTVLFSSDTVGGEEIGAAGEGLHEATNALDNYFFLDDIGLGEAGEIRLTVVLDGETQGNDYQDTLADLQMAFAVELGAAAPPEPTPTPGEPTPTPGAPTPTPGNPPANTPGNPNTPGSPNTPETPKIVKTGDEFRPVPYYIAMGVSGVLFLLLGLYSLRQRRREKEAKRS